MSYGREFLADHAYELEHDLPIKEIMIPTKKGNKKMGQLVFILGRSGTGKSYSIKNFLTDKVAIINVQGKILPFRGGTEIEQVSVDDSAEIVKHIEKYSRHYQSIVVDDYQYVMANEFMRRAYEGGWDKFTEIARHAWDIANKVRELPQNVIVYILCHTDTDGEGTERLKTIGKMLDEKICLEGMSTIVLKTVVSDGKYCFVTQNSGKDTVKSPADMFPSYAIENDLWYVDQKIREYYGLGATMTSEELADADNEVAKPEVTKETSGGKRRRRSAAAIADAAKEETPIEQKPAESEETKTPRRRRIKQERKEEEDQIREQYANNVPESEDGSDAVDYEDTKEPEIDELPKRRRRRTTTEPMTETPEPEDEGDKEVATEEPTPRRRRRRA